MTGIRERVLSRPDLQPALQVRDFDTLAAGLNEQAPLVSQSRFVTMRTIVSECDDANGIITALTAAAAQLPVVAEMLTFLRSDSGMDVGHPRTQAQLDAMAQGGMLTTAQAQELKALALQPDTVTPAQVCEELFNPDGSAK